MSRNVLSASLQIAVAWSALLFAMPRPAHAQGERAFIDDFISLPSEVLTIVGDVLPESSQVGASFLSGAFDANLLITERCNVFVTFVHEGAGYRNGVGYFTWRPGGDSVVITSSQLVFPNASYADPSIGWGGGQLATGDTVTLPDANGAPRTFSPGDRIGFFLVSDGWSGGSLRGWSGPGSLPHVDPASNASTSRGLYTTLDGLNPENTTGRADLSRHVAMVRVRGIAGFLGGADFTLMGFEDQRRDGGSDQDFNDAVFVVRSNPIDAIDTDGMVLFDPVDPDPDGDGVEGLDDAFPDDPARAFVVRSPTTDWATVAFEDAYPGVGDGDYNDVVFNYAFEEVLTADGRLHSLIGTFHLIGRGATYDHALDFAVHDLPQGVSAQVSLERFGFDGTHAVGMSSSALLLEGQDGRIGAYVEDIVPSSRDALPPDPSVSVAYTNTTRGEMERAPASARFEMTFSAPVARAPLGAAPFDLHIRVLRDGGIDVHLPGQPPRPDRAPDAPVEDGPVTFVDGNFYPWGLLVPADWRFPLERQFIGGSDGAYPDFTEWRSSLGTRNRTWYDAPHSGGPTRVIDAFSASLRARDWTLRSVQRESTR